MLNANARKFLSVYVTSEGDPKTLAERACLALRRDIIEGVHLPGAKLRVEHLKDRYEVGAGTMREALALLLSDALVCAEGQRGYRVAPISQSDLEDITSMRVMLETEALRRSISNGNDEWEGGLVAAYHRLSKAEDPLDATGSENALAWEMRDRDFHEALIGACGSPWLRYMLGVLHRQSERYRHLTSAYGSMPRDVRADHREIFDAALAKDSQRAGNALEAHLRRTFDRLVQLPPEGLPLFGY